MNIGHNKYFAPAIVGVICIVVFICFHFSLHNSFTNWDDDVYVSNDSYIKSLSAENLKAIFTQDITKNNFHPLCMLSLAVNYYFTGLSPESYYLTNILIHIANVILVFILIQKVCRRFKIADEGMLIISSFGALWFGIHPMHVESVSWIAERKDVLYAFFYFAGLIAYLNYLNGGKRKWQLFTYLFFIVSCLSKPMAVVFPLSLLCFDFLFSGKLDRKMIVSKIPFLLVSVLFGAMAIYTQNKTGAIAPFSTLSIGERIMYASYGFMMYLVKFFMPTSLSTFYPYPYRYISGWLPWEYYAAPLISLALVLVPLWLTYKQYRQYFNIILFGIGFFVVNILFVLQLISCGAAIMADRYSYVSYTGLLFVSAFFCNEVVKRFPYFKITLIAMILGISGWFGYLCEERTHVWHNSETLLKDAISKYPYRALLSYKWLGNYYMGTGNFTGALDAYNVLITLNQADAKTLDNVGNIYRLQNDYGKAQEAFEKSLKVQNNVYKTYLDMSVNYSLAGDSANALRSLSVAQQLNPTSEKICADTGFSMVQRRQYEGTAILYGVLLKFNSKNPFYYFYRGVSEFGLGKLPAAARDWEIAANSNIKDVSPVAAYNLSVAYDSLGNNPKAIFYANLSQKMGYKVDSAYLNKLESRRTEDKK